MYADYVRTLIWIAHFHIQDHAYKYQVQFSNSKNVSATLNDINNLATNNISTTNK